MSAFDLSLEDLVAAYDARFERTPLCAAARSDKLLLMSVDATFCNRVWTVAGTRAEAHPLHGGAEPTFLQLKYLAYAIKSNGPPEEAKAELAAQFQDWCESNPGVDFTVLRFNPTARPAPTPEAEQTAPPSPPQALQQPEQPPSTTESVILEEHELSEESKIMLAFFNGRSPHQIETFQDHPLPGEKSRRNCCGT